MNIINFSKPSQVSTARNLSITVSSTIKVAYYHSRIVRMYCVYLRCVSGSSRVTARRRLLVRANLKQH
jgi:hypothetical protein